MLENCKSAKERWGGVSEIIDRWLQNRQNMLVCYCELSGLQESEPDDSVPTDAKLRRLCQIMVDYISAGHFEIYDQLIKEGQEFEDQAALEQAGSLYKAIDQTTEVMLDLNDKYQETDDLTTLANDLSGLGEVLESRFEAEDRMISVLHTAHKDLVA